MSENSFKSIRNGAIASVIAGVILLAVPVLRGYLVSFLSWLWSGVIWCWEALVASYSLPGWVWLLIFILAFVGLVNIYLVLKGESEEPEFKSYIEDFIYGAKWRWSWVGNQISNVWCFCPRCDATLVYDDSSCRSLYSDVNKTDFICENCGHSVVASITGGNKEYATGAIRREIERRVRTGEYKKH
mgnify:FL=1|jgi:predicted RNA-binding Zn-ribbon protein involved in translation (DUF1610 family)|tara:strand:- start:251 stop:808 length:558 start_codon:yes stop_codon:yes gene_type:complete